MKHLKLFENTEINFLKKFLEKAINNKDIILNNISVVDLINKYKKPKLGTFEQLIDDEARFISFAHSKNMPEYVKKFEELGLNVDKLKLLIDDYKKYYDNIFLEDELQIDLTTGGFDKETKKEIKEKIEKILDEYYQNLLINLKKK